MAVTSPFWMASEPDNIARSLRNSLINHPNSNSVAAVTPEASRD